MPRIINPKHEEIAISLSKGETQTNAYLAAFGCKSRRSAENGASRLMKHSRYGDQIRARRDELIQLERAKERQVLDLADNSPPTKTWIVAQLKHVVAMGRQAGNLAAMNKALELLGKVDGVWDAKAKRTLSLDDLSLEDLQKLADELAADPDVIAAMAEKSALNLSTDEA